MSISMCITFLTAVHLVFIIATYAVPYGDIWIRWIAKWFSHLDEGYFAASLVLRNATSCLHRITEEKYITVDIGKLGSIGRCQ